MGKTVFITGIAGFIGFHTALRLAERGDEVWGVDNLNNYYMPQLKWKRENYLKKRGIHVWEGDICKRLPDQWKSTHMLHLAAQAGVRYSLENPESYVQSNVAGFLQVLEACRRWEIPLTYASSSSVYGTNKKTPFTEEDRVDSPANLYAATKRSGELMAASYHHCYGIPVTGLRYFTVFGPWGRPDMAYFHFAHKILRELPIQLYNRGEMARDFTYIDDIVDGTIAALDRESDCEVFNLGHHRPIPLTTLVSTLEELLGKKAHVELVDSPVGEVKTTFADLTKSAKLLRYTPKVPFEEGMRQFVDWLLSPDGIYLPA